MKVLACGSRTFKANVVWTVLDGIWQEQNIGYLVVHMDPFTLIEGGAQGADSLARDWSRSSPLHTHNEKPAEEEQPFNLLTLNARWTEHAAGWCPGAWCSSSEKGYCVAAGGRRNQEMLERGPDLVIAFVDKPLTDSKGTLDMVTRAEEAGVETWVIHHTPRRVIPDGDW